MPQGNTTMPFGGRMHQLEIFCQGSLSWNELSLERLLPRWAVTIDWA